MNLPYLRTERLVRDRKADEHYMKQRQFTAWLFWLFVTVLGVVLFLHFVYPVRAAAVLDPRNDACAEGNCP